MVLTHFPDSRESAAFETALERGVPPIDAELVGAVLPGLDTVALPERASHQLADAIRQSLMSRVLPGKA